MTSFSTEPRLGMTALATVDAGFTPPNSATLIPTPPSYLGMVARYLDSVNGEGEFILLSGVAGTVVGSLVNYNQTTFTTTLNPNTANLAQPVAVAMSANVATTTFGWYQISGVATIKKTAVKVNPNVALFQSATAGRVMPTVASGKELMGVRSANAATVASATSTITAILDRPHMQGQTI